VIAADTTISKLPEVSRMVPMAVTYANARSVTEVAAENSVLELKTDINATVNTETLAATKTVNDTYSIAAGTLFTTVTCNNFDSVDLLSGSLLLDFEGIWSGNIVNSGAIAVVFEGVSAFGEGTVISASIPGWGILPAAAYGTTAADSGSAVVYFNIPEPTTGVLSVLALAALAARRRRSKANESAND